MITCSIPTKTAKFKAKHKKKKKSTVETLSNELFSLNDKDNEIKMEEYADKIRVKMSVE